MATYATSAEAKSYLRIPDTDTQDDDRVDLALEAATDAIDQALGTTGNQLDPVPAMIKQACLIQMARWFKRQDSPFGVLGSPEFGNYTRLLNRLDPDVEVLLSGNGERHRYGTTA